MTYRGIVRGGVVVPEEGVMLPEGAEVEILSAEPAPPTDSVPGFGLWRDRADMTDSGEASLRLRREAEKRSAGDAD